MSWPVSLAFPLAGGSWVAPKSRAAGGRRRSPVLAGSCAAVQGRVRGANPRAWHPGRLLSVTTVAFEDEHIGVPLGSANTQCQGLVPILVAAVLHAHRRVEIASLHGSHPSWLPRRPPRTASDLNGLGLPAEYQPLGSPSSPPERAGLGHDENPLIDAALRRVLVLRRRAGQSACYGQRWPHGKTQRNVRSTGRLHQQSSLQPQATAPMPSTNVPITAKSEQTGAGVVPDELRTGRSRTCSNVCGRM